jgi:hypothetical protein
MVSMVSEVLTAHILSAWPGYGVYGVYAGLTIWIVGGWSGLWCLWWPGLLNRQWVVGAMVAMMSEGLAGCIDRT